VVSRLFGLTDGQPKTLDEIGKVHGVTRERIRQIESNTTPRLRHPSPVQARGGKSEVSQPDPRNRQTSPEAESGNDQLNLGTAPNTAPDNTPVGHRADRADRAARHGRDTAAPQPGRQPDPGPGARGQQGLVRAGGFGAVAAGPRQSAPTPSGHHGGRWPHRAGFIAPDSQSALSGRRDCAVLPGASALLADPHRYVGGFQGLVYDSGQVVPD
jgi:hypothetical protein